MSNPSSVKRSFPTIVERRRRYIASKFPVTAVKMLEIGAMDMPTFHPDEAAIFFMDYFSDEEFANLAARNQISRPLENLMHVDFVTKRKHFAKDVQNSFDVIIAAHVIEHVADPIAWLRELQSLLTETGRIFLCIPDRRYTFDILRRESTPFDLLRAFRSDATVPDIYTIAEFFYYNRHVSVADCWGDPVALQNKIAKKNYSVNSSMQRAQAMIVGEEVHVNVHATVYSYPTFASLWDGLTETGLLDLDLEDIVDADRDSNEFWVLLNRRVPASSASS